MYGVLKEKIMLFDKYEQKGAYHWALYNRHPGYRLHVKRVLSWVRKGRTLDVGAGDGLITYLLKATGIDDNECAVGLAKKRNAKVEVGSAYNLSTYTGYDNILMLDVIEHLEAPEKALEEVKKILGDGWLYITTPFAKPPGVLNEYHFQEWTKDGLVLFVEQNGFKCIEATTYPKNKQIYAVFTL